MAYEPRATEHGGKLGESNAEFVSLFWLSLYTCIVYKSSQIHIIVVNRLRVVRAIKGPSTLAMDVAACSLFAGSTQTETAHHYINRAVGSGKGELSNLEIWTLPHFEYSPIHCLASDLHLALLTGAGGSQKGEQLV